MSYTDKYSLIREKQILEIENEMLRNKVKKLTYELETLMNEIKQNDNIRNTETKTS